jgi:hypothetical protein
MNTRHVACLLLLLCSAQLHAQDFSCDAERGKALMSIEELPAQVLYLLGHAKTGLDGIADIGGKFNPTDAIVDDTWPMRRLVSGVMGRHCIRLIVEYGGLGHYQKMQEYHRTENLWLQTAGAEIPRSPSSAPAHPGAFADVQSFMDAYGNDLRNGDREAVAGRYDRRGAYFLGNGKKQLRSFDEIRQRYLQTWRPPLSFSWRDLSFERAGDNAVLVVGLLDWGTPEGQITFSYTGLLLRDGKSFKIRLEDESRAVPPAATEIRQ